MVLGTLALQLGAIYWAPARAIMRTEPLAVMDLGIVLVASTAAFWVVEVEKFIRPVATGSTRARWMAARHLKD